MGSSKSKFSSGESKESTTRLEDAPSIKFSAEPIVIDSKIVLMGESRTGKSMILERIIKDAFTTAY